MKILNTEKTSYEYTNSNQREGGNAFVKKGYESEDTTKKNPVAIKFLKLNDKEKIKRFNREIEVTKSLNHRNIVKILDSGQNTNENLYYIMPYYKENLKSFLKNNPKTTTEEKIKIIIKILEGLNYLHLKNFIHRDLKPENILVNSLDDIVIADLGIVETKSKYYFSTKITQYDSRVHNYKYPSPEQLNKGSTDEKTDIYSIGLIIHEIFSGIVPNGKNPIKLFNINMELDYLDFLIGEMLEYEPKNRIDAKNVLSKFEEFISIMENPILKKIAKNNSPPSINQNLKKIDLNENNNFYLKKRFKDTYGDEYHLIKKTYNHKRTIKIYHDVEIIWMIKNKENLLILYEDSFGFNYDLLNLKFQQFKKSLNNSMNMGIPVVFFNENHFFLKFYFNNSFNIKVLIDDRLFTIKK